MKTFRLAIICRGSKNHPFVEKLSEYEAIVQPVSDHMLSTILSLMFQDVVTYMSEVAGLGKSSLISKAARIKQKSIVTFHISGHISRNSFVYDLKALNLKDYHDLHLDIGSVNDPKELDTLIFELIVLSYVADKSTAVYLSTKTVYIEIANSINDSLRNALPTATSFKTEHLQWRHFNDYTACMEINSPNQVVCQYLKAIKENYLDTQDIHLPTQTPLSEDTCRELLRSSLDVTSDISYSIVNTFLKCLADQLKRFSCSAFFRVRNLTGMVDTDSCITVRSSLIQAMIDGSREFACRSVQSCRSTQNSTVSNDESQTNGHDITAKCVSRTNNMVRWEESNHLMYVFHNQHIQTLSLMYRDKQQVPKPIQKLFEIQMKRELENYALRTQEQLQDMLQRVARTNPSPLQPDRMSEMTKQYALTPDNLLKMVLIMLRIQSSVPVLVMGETGCGKTSLIRYLAWICEVSMVVLNIHSSITAKCVIKAVMSENKWCLDHPKEKRWLFLDEINTTECIGLISDIICHRTCCGCIIAPNLTIMGACNPYKLRTSEAILTAGLSGKAKTDDLSKLVYRVLPLPEMIVDYVWDFGSLSDADERKYIERMSHSVFDSAEMHVLLTDLISASQVFVRGIEKAACVVSLRDVNRCLLLVSWFLNMMRLNKYLFVKTVSICQEIKAMILALTHCYHCRFTSKEIRKQYRQLLVRKLTKQTSDVIKAEDDVCNIVQEAQSELLNRMELPPGTAKNTALKENVFMILVCILNKIPIFVVGKPGCSKSLAIQIIRSNLRGKDSKDIFFKTLPQLYCVSFQGSESSTSEGILKVFEKAEKYRESNSKDDVLSVVILDEIGLAEISKFNPLKVLHNLLEPNGNSLPNVAVVGISNWSLDASKMNRAIHLCRTDMNEEELFETAKSICQSFVKTIEGKATGLLENQCNNDLKLSDISAELNFIASAYTSYTHKLQFRHFHGLRDFYALVKFISKRLLSNNQEGKSKAIMEGLHRNFGGLKSERDNLLSEFKLCISQTSTDWNITDLIKENIHDTIARHLLIITRGESVLGLLEQLLKDTGRNTQEIIFGSQFEEDLTDEYQYRILSRIILCMEQGIILILKDLDHIYGSLYDMLNQNYTRIGMKNNCRIAIGPYSNPFCHVSETFRCIVLVESCQLHKTDPPFLNRFEKQCLSFADILSDEDKKLVEQINCWIEKISAIEERSFTKHDIFPFYNDDLIISLVIFMTRKHRSIGNSELNLLNECINALMWIITPDAVLRLRRALNKDVRMENRRMMKEYFELPLHDGLEHLIEFHQKQIEDDFLKCQSERGKVSPVRMTVVFTFSNIHTRMPDHVNDLTVQTENLGTFKSEKKLSNRLKEFWKSNTNVLLVHCHAIEDEQHLTLTMSLIKHIRLEVEEQSSFNCYKLVYILLHMGVRLVHVASTQDDETYHSSIGNINFLSGWELLTLESLNKPAYSVPCLSSQTLTRTINSMCPLSKHLQDELFWSFSRIRYGRRSRNVDSVSSVIDKIQKSTLILNALESKILTYIAKSVDSISNENWCVNLACNANALNTSALFVDALLRHIMKTIKTPLAKMIVKLEQEGAIDSFFVVDTLTSLRQEYWLEGFNSESFSVLTMQVESGPECFQCIIPDLALKMPFSRRIFEENESTKDTFLIEVTRAKAKCDIDANGELPDEIMSELIKQHRDILSVKLHFKECSGYVQHFIDDYLEDYCNQLAYQCCFGLSQKVRIETCLWVMGQFIDLSEIKSKPLLEVFALLHCTGWTRMSTFNSVLELCSVFCFGFPAVDSPVSTFTAISQNDEQSDGHRSSRRISLQERGLADTAQHEPPNTDDETESEGDDESHDDTNDNETKFRNFVACLCSLAVPTRENRNNLASSTQLEHILRNIVLAARNISDSSMEYQALRLCSEIHSLAVVQSKVSEDLFFELALSLKEDEIGSSLVRSKIEMIVESINDSQSLLRIVRQYLITCMSAPDETHFYFVIDMLKMKIFPKDEVHLLKFPFEVRIGCDVISIDIIKTIITHSESTKTSKVFIQHPFLSLLDNSLEAVVHNEETIHPFAVMILDILEAQICKFCLFDSDVILACGRVLQSKLCLKTGLRFFTSVAYIRSVTHYLANRHETAGFFEDQLLDSYVCMLNGLDNDQYGHQILILLLKYTSLDACISSVIRLQRSIAEKTKLELTINWSDKYIDTCVELNTLCHHLDLNFVIEACKCLKLEKRRAVTLGANLEIGLTRVTSNIEAGQQTMLAYILSLKEFYLPRYIKMLDEKDRSLARVMTSCFDQCLSPVQMRFLRCTLGLEDFLDERLTHSPETKYQQFVWNSVLVSLFALIIASSDDNTDIKTCPPFIRCLLFPLDQAEISFTGLSVESIQCSFKSMNTIDKLYNCNCGNVMLFHKKPIQAKCTTCGSDVDSNNSPSGSIIESHDSEQEFKTTPYLSPIAKKIFQFFVDGCLLGSLALKIIKPEQVLTRFAETSLNSNIFDVLWDNLHTHWNDITSMLNTYDFETGMLFHIIMLKGKDLLFKNACNMSTENGRCEWETAFERTVAINTSNLFQELSVFIRTTDESFDVNTKSVELQIRESDELCISNSCLFRQTRVATKPDFACQLYRMKNEYQFLQYVVENESSLKLPEHIYNIIQWHMSSVVNINYNLKRKECLDKSVHEYHSTVNDKRAKDASTKRFSAFKNSWNFLSKQFIGLNMQAVDVRSKMCDCLLLSQDGLIYKVLNILIDTQNQCIHHALQLAKNCTSLQFLLRSTDVSSTRSVFVSEVRKDDLIAFDDNWLMVCINQESHCGLKYGDGRRIHYDFQNIEKRLAEKLLFGKAYVSLNDLPDIVFIDELYRNYVTLVNDVCLAVKQSKLPKVLEDSLRKKNEDNKCLSFELLGNLDILLTVLKRSKYEHDIPLIEFVNERQSTLARGFPIQHLPSSEITLCVGHVISLHEILEELSAERKIDGLGVEYYAELEHDTEQYFRTIKNAEKAECILKALKRFTYRCICMTENSIDQPLIQFLSQPSFWPANDSGNNQTPIKDEDVHDIFLPDVLICNIGTIIRILTETIEKLQNKEERIDGVITSWKAKEKQKKSSRPGNTHKRKARGITKDA